MSIPTTISAYLRAYGNELGEKVSTQFPPLHSPGDPIWPALKLLKRSHSPLKLWLSSVSLSAGRKPARPLRWQNVEPARPWSAWAPCSHTRADAVSPHWQCARPLSSKNG